MAELDQAQRAVEETLMMSVRAQDIDLEQPRRKLSIFVKITLTGPAITLAGLLFLEALIESDL